MHFHLTESGKRRIIGAMVYSFARVGAVVGMNVEDYFQQGKRWWFRLHEKGGKRHAVAITTGLNPYMKSHMNIELTPVVAPSLVVVAIGLVLVAPHCVEVRMIGIGLAGGSPHRRAPERHGISMMARNAQYPTGQLPHARRRPEGVSRWK